MEPEQSGGYVFRGSDGSLYLIRDDILEACKIDGGDLDFARQFERARQDDSAGRGFAMAEGPFMDIGRVDDTCATHPNDVCEPRPDPPSTMMCGW